MLLEHTEGAVESSCLPKFPRSVLLKGKCAHKSPGGLTAHPDSEGPGRALESAFLTSSLEMLMLLSEDHTRTAKDPH